MTRRVAITGACGQGRAAARLAVLGMVCLLVLAAAWPRQVRAQETAPAPFPDFTFKTVRPPAPDARKRITVQIGPGDQAAPERDETEPAPGPAVAATPGPEHYGWFWEAISPAASETGPGRLQAALRVLATAPAGQAVSAPRLAELARIARARQAPILLNNAGTRVSPALALAVIFVESRGDPAAESRAGAQGLMQLMPATAARFGVSDPFDPAQNIAGGIAFLDRLLEKFEGDPVLALAGYNAGETQLALHEGVPDLAETRDYVPRVLAAFAVARGLCITPPELISDGCVFRLAE